MAGPIDRKLAAILSADVVGYSRLMAEDEAATIRTLTDYREQIALRVRQHRGRVVDAPGDNVLAEFPTALDAVRCAVEIQAVLRALNTSLPAERRMDFRIGVHMGDVAAEGERIYGDGVNIAARLEALAEAGGICISATVHEQVRNKLDAGFSDLGDQTVKNIPDQVHVYRVQPRGQSETPARAKAAPGERPRRLRTALVTTAAVLLLLGVGLWASWPRPLGLLIDLAGVSGPPVDPPLPDKPSIVVLPFANISGDSEQEYFGDGLMEDLTTELARNPNLFVASRNSALLYKDQPIKIEDVGRELGVRYVLEGSVRKAGDRVRVTAQLIDATTGGHVWSQRYDRELSDIFAIQSEIAEEILVAVGLEIRAAESQRLARRTTESLSALDTSWKGLHHLFLQTRDDNLEARRLFERAIELDPEFAAAHALLGNTYTAEFGNGWSSDPKLLDRGEALARRAIDEAIAAADRAIALVPSWETSHAMRGAALAQEGRLLEAMRSVRRALRLNPRAPTAVLLSVAYVNLAAGRPQEAVANLERVRAGRPDNVVARVGLAVLVRPDLTPEEALATLPGLEGIVGAEEFARYPGYLRTAGFR
jgi:adenylate cyclase